jgi:amphiphysin
MHDERLKGLIPSIMDTISAFFSPMLNTMYAVQSDLYQHLYASVYEYATSQGLSNTDNLVEECGSLYEPIRQKVESEIKSLREGKIARIPVGEFTGKPGLFGRKPSSLPPVRPMKSARPPPPYTPQQEGPSTSLQLPPSSTTFRKPSPPAGPSPLLTPNSRQNPHGGSRTSSSSSISSDAAKKKKPPPPPPPKPSISPKPEFVTAKYDFAGESQGDLTFKVGDRIKIIKKTDSMEDWWEGELNGSRGMFPRNYCD